MNNDEKEINKINERLTSKLTHYLSYFNLVEKKNVQEFSFFPNLPVEITGLYPRHLQVLFRPGLSNQEGSSRKQNG